MERVWLNQALETCRRLGGRIVRYRGNDIADEIARYAPAKQCQHDYAWKTPPHGIDVLFSPVYRVIRNSHGIDIHLYEPKGNGLHLPLQRRIPLFFTAEYAISLILITAVVSFNFLLKDHIGPMNLLIIQILPVRRHQHILCEYI